MHQQIACPAPNGEIVLSIDGIDFSQIPGQSRLFTQYQHDPLLLQKFYPNAVPSHDRIADRISEVLANHKADRQVLCDTLDEMNRKFGASEKTLEHIQLLRDDDTVAVVSGQQAGLYTGPLYTIYKALSAVRMAECLRSRGFKAVPVFWVATEDHDFEEVSKTHILGRDGADVLLSNQPKRCYDELPVGYIKLDDSIAATTSELFSALEKTEFTDELRSMIEDAWSNGAYFGDAFARLLTQILGEHGVIILCPLDSRLKSLAAPVYIKAIERSHEIVDALRVRSEELVHDGYVAQVHVAEDYFPLFWQARDGTRNALKKDSEGAFWTKDGSRRFTLEELAQIAEREPGRFSPSVVLRSVVQDYLLPTACYFGGGAEIAYFAQSSEVYRLLDRPVTPILHRQSFTVIESRQRRAMERFGIEFTDLFAGIDELLPRLVNEHLNRDTARLIADVEEKINTELNRLDQEFSKLDPTLAENLATRRRKIIYHIGALRGKFQRSQFSRDETVNRQINGLFASVLPQGHLQERSLNVLYFLNKYGPGFVDWIYRSIDLGDKGHRIIRL
ncbi:MAG: bacillithiol biosynthesis cysteine-adding enzyme BshC [Acidobacteria bacterium]|nr:bacillithiol biosynthesis cysteine-adding enzyme BshC [Acidobacteriota bacterium]